MPCQSTHQHSQAPTHPAPACILWSAVQGDLEIASREDAVQHSQAYDAINGTLRFVGCPHGKACDRAPLTVSFQHLACVTHDLVVTGNSGNHLSMARAFPALEAVRGSVTFSWLQRCD